MIKLMNRQQSELTRKLKSTSLKKHRKTKNYKRKFVNYITI